MEEKQATPQEDFIKDPETTIVGIHRIDDEGNPAGGSITSLGVEINWQNGPLGSGEERKDPNGAQVEDVITAAIDRLTFFQHAANGKFACTWNNKAIIKLKSALESLKARTKDRESRQVEGTYKP